MVEYKAPEFQLKKTTIPSPKNDATDWAACCSLLHEGSLL